MPSLSLTRFRHSITNQCNYVGKEGQETPYLMVERRMVVDAVAVKCANVAGDEPVKLHDGPTVDEQITNELLAKKKIELST